eukprot:Phypoly_transcript_07910.p1 GENE.Phypoly_transcript_07910~~Phypoly_transcript_07910.p1  ORF type:complete len:524 (+),score=40.43 Phypoly_transcript_07910:107-1573(+)
MDAGHALELAKSIISAVPVLRTAPIPNDTFSVNAGSNGVGKLQIARDILLHVSQLIEVQIKELTKGCYSNIPSDVTIKIFEYLSAEVILDSVRFVSKEWRQCTKSNSLWQSLSKLYLYGSEYPLVHLSSNFSYSGPLPKFRQYLPMVSEIYLFCESFTRYRTHFMSQRLQRLVLFRCDMDDSDLTFISTCCPNLVSLSLVDSGTVSDEGLLALGALTHLQELTISRFDESSGYSVPNPHVHHLTSLTSLILGGGGRDIGLILKNVTSLRNLYYEDRTGNIDGWQFLTKLTSLDHLGIAFRSQIDLPQICSLFPILTHLTQLKTLLFNPIFFSSADTEVAILFFNMLRCMTRLEYIGNLGEIPLDAWPSFPILPSIQRLSFCFTFSPSDEYMDTMVNVCKSLPSLRIFTFGVFCAELRIDVLKKFSILTQLERFYFCVSDNAEVMKCNKELRNAFKKWLPKTRLIITSPENIAEFDESISDMKLIINIT